MKHKLLLYLRNISYYFLASLGLAIIVWIIWVRFIRERLPRDIPFQLTEFRFYILLYVCFIYLYIIKNLLRPKETPEIVVWLIDKLFLPLVYLDEAIKNNKYIKEKYTRLLNIILKRLPELYYNDFKLIYIFYNIIPRIVLVTILCFDTFYMHKLDILYDIIFLGFIPLFHRYVKYSIKYAKKQFLKTITDKYDEVILTEINFAKGNWEYNPEIMIYHLKSVSIEKYLEIYIECYYNTENNIQYEGHPLAKEEIYEQYIREKNMSETTELVEGDYAKIKKEYYDIMPRLLLLTITMDSYSLITLIPKIKYIRLCIYSIYFICWLYILLLSYHTLEGLPRMIKVLIWIEAYIEKIEPFSGIIL